MENLESLCQKIQEFFELVENHENQIQDWIIASKKPCSSIVNQSLFYRAILQESTFDNSSIIGFENFEGFKNGLAYEIFKSLQENLTILENIR